MNTNPLESIPSFDRTTTFFARRPRHEPGPVRSRTAFTIIGGEATEWFDAQLLDVSRAGIKLGATIEVSREASVTVSIHSAEEAGLLECDCAVRWCKREGDEAFPWHLGLEFPAPLPWETLGELFLHGVLNAGPAAKA